MLRSVIFFLFLLFLVVADQEKCSNVIPQEDFDINQFLGNWYVIQQTKTESRCVQHQITPLEKEGEYRISQVSPHHILDKFPLQHEHTYAGFLTTDAISSGRMKVRYALSFGEDAYIVVTTDYDAFAGIITCGAVGGSRIATILSRTPSLPDEKILEIREKMDGFGVKISDLSTISHKNCPTDGFKGLNIKIGHDLLSPQRIGGVFQNIASDIGGAIENGAKFLGGFLNRKSRRV